MDLHNLLEKSVTPEDAKLFLKMAAESDWPLFLKELSLVVAHGSSTPVARMAAGLELIDALTSKDPKVKLHYHNRWIELPNDVRNFVKQNIFSSLGKEFTRRSFSSQIVGLIAAIEIPVNNWPEFTSLIVKNITDKNRSGSIYTASMDVLRCIVDEWGSHHHEILKKMYDRIKEAVEKMGKDKIAIVELNEVFENKKKKEENVVKSVESSGASPFKDILKTSVDASSDQKDVPNSGKTWEYKENTRSLTEALMELFPLYAKICHGDDASKICLTNVIVWCRQAKILEDKEFNLKPVDLSLFFKKKSAKPAITYDEFLDYVEKIEVDRKLEKNSILRKLVSAGVPKISNTAPKGKTQQPHRCQEQDDAGVIARLIKSPDESF